jgi:dTDP-4-amino-4,6-dideoxygalactose transaminase
MDKRIFLSSPHMSGQELIYVNEAFASNWIAPLGPHVEAFEAALSEYTGAGHTAVLSSGTAAIHLALVILGVRAGDEVITSSFTFSATVNPIVYQGATPVLIDSERDTWNMSPGLLESALRERAAKGKLPKAIILVHLYGMPAKIADIKAIANNYGIPLIEDAAEALGSRYKGRQPGVFGKIGILSFNGNKIITTAGGGALISDDPEIVGKARFLATQARDKAPHYQHSNIGYNYRMSNILAAIGRGQIGVLDERVRQRRSNYFFYRERLEKYDGISFLPEPDDSYFSNHWLTTVLIDPAKSRMNREQLQVNLEKKNIETRPLWKPMHLQPVFASCPSYMDGTSEDLFSKGLCLPSGSNLTEEDRFRIITALDEALGGGDSRGTPR